MLETKTQTQTIHRNTQTNHQHTKTDQTNIYAMKKNAEEISEAKRATGIQQANAERDGAYRAAEDNHVEALRKNEAEKQPAMK